MNFLKKLFGRASDSAEARDLLLAAQGGDRAAIDSLLARGVDINLRTDHGITALMGASHFGRHEVVLLLLAKGADVDAMDMDGSTALLTASQRGHAGIVKALVDAGANINGPAPV